MIQYKIRKSTLMRYANVVENYADYDGMTISEFQKVSRVSSGLFYAMIREGLFKKIGTTNVYAAQNIDRKRKLCKKIVDRVIRDCCLTKARQNQANRDKRVLSDPNPVPGMNERPAQDQPKATTPEPVNGTIPFIEETPVQIDFRKPKQPKTDPAKLFEPEEFEQICLDYLKSVTIQIPGATVNKYDIYLNKPVIEKTKL